MIILLLLLIIYYIYITLPNKYYKNIRRIHNKSNTYNSLTLLGAKSRVTSSKTGIFLTISTTCVNSL
ncbi:hypothetical protein Hanom_Chr04g00382231 [Helianthus anomalus]